MHATREQIAPKESFFADPNVLGDEAKLLAAVQQAGFKDCQCRHTFSDCFRSCCGILHCTYACARIDDNIIAQYVLLLQASEVGLTCAREVNVDMRIETSRLRPAVMDNAVVSELLNRLQAQGEHDFYDRALQAMLDAAAKAGYMQEDGTVLHAPQNVALFVTARA